MALQEDDQLWEHLQGKSREELLGLLEQIMKKQPEIKGLLKLLLELPLTSGARAEHKAGVGRGRSPRWRAGGLSWRSALLSGSAARAIS